MFGVIINNCLKELRAGKSISDREIVELLLQTLSYLATESTASAILSGSYSYVVHPYARAAADLAKGRLAEDREGELSMRLDLAICAAGEHLAQAVTAGDNDCLFPNRLAAAVNVLTRLAVLPYGKDRENLCAELAAALADWLEYFVDEEQLSGEPSLKAAETEE